MFANVELAARIDAAEGRLCADIVAAGASDASTSRSLVTPLAGGLLVYASPGSPMNKGIGIALTEPLEEAPLAAVEQEWRDRNEPMRIELSSLARPEAATMLTAGGYRLVGFENQLGCELETWGQAPGPGPRGPGFGLRAPAGKSSLRIFPMPTRNSGVMSPSMALRIRTNRRRHTKSSRARCWTTSSSRSDAREGFDGMSRESTDTLRARRACGSTATLRSWPVRRHCRPSAAEACRRHYSVTVWLTRDDDGCTLAVVTTQPGSTSQANVQRWGFTLLYTRAILVRRW